jgi:GNAT superfamily N-acetyltransferase
MIAGMPRDERHDAPRLRIATVDDVPPLVALIESAYRGDESRQGWTTEADLLEGRRTSPAQVAAIVEGPAGCMIVAEDDTGLLGCCHLERREGGRAYLGMLSVRPRLQSRGIGRRIMDEAERIAGEDWGANELRMWVISRRTDLIPWYERMGYVRTGETMPFGNEPHEQAERADLEFVVLAKAMRARGDV